MGQPKVLKTQESRGLFKILGVLKLMSHEILTFD